MRLMKEFGSGLLLEGNSHKHTNHIKNVSRWEQDGFMANKLVFCKPELPQTRTLTLLFKLQSTLFPYYSIFFPLKNISTKFENSKIHISSIKIPVFAIQLKLYLFHLKINCRLT